MAHCRDCGNPVSREESRCGLCGAPLRSGVRAEPFRSDRPMAPGYPPAMTKRPLFHSRPKGAPLLLIALPAVVIAVALMMMAYGPVMLQKAHGFESVTRSDYVTLSITFRGWGVAFTECRVIVGLNHGQAEGAVTGAGEGHLLMLSVNEEMATIRFVDLSADGHIDQGDMMLVSVPGVESGDVLTLRVALNSGVSLGEMSYTF